MSSKKILTFLGTRPEAIKMIPVIKALKNSGFDVAVGLSGQHTTMVESVFELFNETYDFSLDIQSQIRNIEDTLCLSLSKLCTYLRENKQDLILVHGDTSSTLAGSMAGYYNQIPVGHVEAGLRSHNIFSPWPEEINRKLTGSIGQLHFAPTLSAKNNLLREGIKEENIHVTGNTVVDALFLMNTLNQTRTELKEQLEKKFSFLNPDKKWILYTGHRRENFGDGLNRVMQAVLKLAQRDDVEVIFPIHPNPNVRNSFKELLPEDSPVHIVEPLPYSEMVWVLSRANLVITDSGGLQEEAPSFKVPVVVTRDTTERLETLETGWAKLVGTDTQAIIKASEDFLDSAQLKLKLSNSSNPYGDGTASLQIVQTIQNYFIKDQIFALKDQTL